MDYSWEMNRVGSIPRAYCGAPVHSDDGCWTSGIIWRFDATLVGPRIHSQATE